MNKRVAVSIAVALLFSGLNVVVAGDNLRDQDLKVRADHYASLCAEGKITAAERDDLILGLKDFANMRALAQHKRVPFPELMPKPEAKPTFQQYMERYAQDLKEGKLSQVAYDELVAGRKQVANMEAISQHRPLPFPELMPKPEVTPTFQQYMEQYAQELREGKLSQAEYDDLVAGRKQVANMQAMSQHRPLPYPEVEQAAK